MPSMKHILRIAHVKLFLSDIEGKQYKNCIQYSGLNDLSEHKMLYMFPVCVSRRKATGGARPAASISCVC